MYCDFVLKEDSCRILENLFIPVFNDYYLHLYNDSGLQLLLRQLGLTYRPRLLEIS